MRYYKEIDIPGWQEVAEKIKEYVFNHPELINPENRASPYVLCDTIDLMISVPEILNLFKPLGLSINRVALIVLYLPTMGVHRDVTDHEVRMLLPIHNCEYTWTKFFTTSVPPVLDRQPNGIKFWRIDGELTEVDKFNLRMPTAFRPKEVHNVFVDREVYPRISASITFHEDASWLLDD